MYAHIQASKYLFHCLLFYTTYIAFNNILWHAEREKEMQSEKVELTSMSYSDMELSERIFKISRINRLKT